MTEEQKNDILEKYRLLELQDDNKKRDNKLYIVWLMVISMLGYPWVLIAAFFFGFADAAKLIGEIATVYFGSCAAIVGAYFGAEAYMSKRE